MQAAAFPVENLPVAQSVGEGEPAGQKEPGGQGVQLAVEAPPVEYVPALQSPAPAGDDVPSGQYLPALQEPLPLLDVAPA